MKLDSIDIHAQKALMADMARIIHSIDEQIIHLIDLMDGMVSDDDMFSGSQEMEQLRFQRKRIRSEYMDHSLLVNIANRHRLECSLMHAVESFSPQTFAEIASQSLQIEVYPADEISTLIQRLAHLYERANTAFNGVQSMREQIHHSTRSGQEQEDWMSRVEFAMNKSIRFYHGLFSITKSLRADIETLSKRTPEHAFYRAACKTLGKEAIRHFTNNQHFEMAA